MIDIGVEGIPGRGVMIGMMMERSRHAQIECWVVGSGDGSIAKLSVCTCIMRLLIIVCCYWILSQNIGNGKRDFTLIKIRCSTRRLRVLLLQLGGNNRWGLEVLGFKRELKSVGWYY